MSSGNQSTEGKRIISSADLMRRGATLLGEACPRCGGVQIRFKGKTYCLNEDDLSSLLSNAPETKAPPTAEQVQATTAKSAPISEGQSQLRKMLEAKLEAVSKQLEASNDPNEQSKLLELISKYVDTLDKLKKASI